jgi:putative pyoverdin transport system ATP-binding/permease protein
MLTVNLLIFTPFVVLKEGIPYLVRAGVSIERIFTFEKKLTNIKTEDTNFETGDGEFSEIKYNNICFDYTDSEGSSVFSLDNINLTVKKGEIIFIVGGNGSGKSTLLKVMTGLYFPLSGSIEIDEKDIDTISFRHLFTAVFSDFHLFDRLYGIENINAEKVAKWLKIMELSDKLSFTDNCFSTLDLSTGQKKRLAMIATIMDDKPIYVFDEWAADQAPEFREYFYRKLLPLFKAQGKTVIAISHDDRYFDVADRVINLDYGRIRIAL